MKHQNLPQQYLKGNKIKNIIKYRSINSAKLVPFTNNSLKNPFKKSEQKYQSTIVFSFSVSHPSTWNFHVIFVLKGKPIIVRERFDLCLKNYGVINQFSSRIYWDFNLCSSQAIKWGNAHKGHHGSVLIPITIFFRNLEDQG